MFHGRPRSSLQLLTHFSPRRRVPIMTDKSLGPVTLKHGPEVRNYYTGSPLNRLSFLREDYKFLSQALRHPSTRFLPLKSLNPALDSEKHLQYLTYDDIKSVTGGDCYAKSEQDQIAEWNSQQDASGVNRVLTVFLGVDESESSSETLSYRDGRYAGRAYFAVDLTPEKTKTETLKGQVEQVLSKVPGEFIALRTNGVSLPDVDAAIYAHARMYVDWNNRNRFCGGCGSMLMSVNGGTKLLCPETDKGVKQPECETRGQVSNLSFPRTDCVVIVAVVDYKCQRLLLGRNKRYPGNMYSCLAGFLEPAESIEECVRREVWEESGVAVGRVMVHSTQPWPYPANIMIGCIAEVKDCTEKSHEIYLEHDPELVDAQWVPFDQVQQALDHKIPDVMFLPPRQAIANVLIKSVINGESVPQPKM